MNSGSTAENDLGASLQGYVIHLDKESAPLRGGPSGLLLGCRPTTRRKQVWVFIPVFMTSVAECREHGISSRTAFRCGR